MKRHLLNLSLLIITAFYSCGNKELLLKLDIDNSKSFSGTFKSDDSNNLTGTVSLDISNRYYICSTNLPYGRGAGKLELNDASINFIDTLFYPAPALYGPTCVLSGKYNYEFDGLNLKIWKEMSVGSIVYDLKLTKTN